MANPKDDNFSESQVITRKQGVKQAYAISSGSVEVARMVIEISPAKSCLKRLSRILWSMSMSNMTSNVMVGSLTLGLKWLMIGIDLRNVKIIIRANI